MKTIMRVTYGCVLLLAGWRFCWGQNAVKPVEATLCDLYQRPDEYAGKIVKVRGTIAGNDMWIDAFTQKSCSSLMSIVVVFPKQVDPAPDFDLVRDDSFKEFEDAMYHSRPIRIEATFEGRFDSVVTMRDGRRAKVGKGYGKKHEHDGRIVLHRVSDVLAKPLPRK
jgi:hypothetical protein